MKLTTYEWIVEWCDEHGDIVDVSGHDTLDEAQANLAEGPAIADLTGEIGLRRDVAEGDCYDSLDIIDRQHAYPGDDAFDYGTTIPKRYAALLSSLAQGA